VKKKGSRSGDVWQALEAPHWSVAIDLAIFPGQAKRTAKDADELFTVFFRRRNASGSKSAKQIDPKNLKEGVISG
jgi:hypothetical protein